MPKDKYVLKNFAVPKAKQIPLAGVISSRVRGGKSFFIALSFLLSLTPSMLGRRDCVQQQISKQLNLSSSCLAKLISQWK